MDKQKLKSGLKRPVESKKDPDERKTKKHPWKDTTTHNTKDPSTPLGKQVLTKQEQLQNQLGTAEKKRAAPKTFTYAVGAEVPKNGKNAANTLMNHLGHGSDELRRFITLARKGDRCELDIRVELSERADHGTTGVWVSDRSAKGGYRPLQEAFYTRPELILNPGNLRVEVVAYTSKSEPKKEMLEAPTTLLHELELHVAPAGRLITEMMAKGKGEELLELVFDFMRRTDDHLSLDHHEQYLRTAARLKDKPPPDYERWANALLESVHNDAAMQVLRAAGDVDPDPALDWLSALFEAVAVNPDAESKLPKPALGNASGGDQPPAPRPPNTDTETLMTYLSDAVHKKTHLLDILDHTRNVLGFPISTVLERYRKVVVPALLKQVPEGATAEETLEILINCGVPAALALDAIEEQVLQ